MVHDIIFFQRRSDLLTITEMERAETYRMQRAAYEAQIKASQAQEAYWKKRMETEFPTRDTNSRNNYSACSPPHENPPYFSDSKKVFINDQFYPFTNLNTFWWKKEGVAFTSCPINHANFKIAVNFFFFNTCCGYFVTLQNVNITAA